MRELTVEEVMGVSGGSLREAVLTDASAGAFVGGFSGPEGLAIGALVGAAVGAALYEM